MFQENSLFPLLFTVRLGVLAWSILQDEKIQGILIRFVEVKLSFLAHDLSCFCQYISSYDYLKETFVNVLACREIRARNVPSPISKFYWSLNWRPRWLQQWNQEERQIYSAKLVERGWRCLVFSGKIQCEVICNIQNYVQDRFDFHAWWTHQGS